MGNIPIKKTIFITAENRNGSTKYNTNIAGKDQKEAATPSLYNAKAEVKVITGAIPKRLSGRLYLFW
jgi:carotenoid cleavage dioxygenase-like enzyme